MPTITNQFDRSPLRARLPPPVPGPGPANAVSAVEATGFDRSTVRLGRSRPAAPSLPGERSHSLPGAVAATIFGLGGSLRRTVADSGLLRTNVDNRSGEAGMKVGRSLDTAAEGKAFFDERLAQANAFLRQHGLEGQVVAKLVKANQITVAGHAVVEHAEWQFFLVPKADLKKVRTDADGAIFVGGRPPALPGLLDEGRMTDWVKEKTGAKGLLRSDHNPLFLGRLNLGDGGMGIYKRVPEFAELGGQQYSSRHVAGLVVVDRAKVHKAIDAGYAQLPGEWGKNGTCQQGAIVTATSLGLDEGRVAKEINGLWLTRLRFGRKGAHAPGS